MRLAYVGAAILAACGGRSDLTDSTVVNPTRLTMALSDYDGPAVFLLTRPDKSAPFPTSIASFMGPAAVQLSQASLSPDGLAICGADGPTGISCADRPNTNSAFGPLSALPGIEGSHQFVAGEIEFPLLSADRLTLYFQANILGPIWQGHRGTTNDPFGEFRELMEIEHEQPYDEAPMFLSRDGCTLYFREREASGWQFFSTQR